MDNKSYTYIFCLDAEDNVVAEKVIAGVFSEDELVNNGVLDHIVDSLPEETRGVFIFECYTCEYMGNLTDEEEIKDNIYQYFIEWRDQNIISIVETYQIKTEIK